MRKLILLVLIAVLAATCAQALAEEGVFHGGDILYTEPLKAVLFSPAMRSPS